MIKIYTDSKNNSHTNVKLGKVNIDAFKNNNKLEIIINPTKLTSKETIIFALELIRSMIILNIKSIPSPRKLIFNSIACKLNKLSNKLKVE